MALAASSAGSLSSGRNSTQPSWRLRPILLSFGWLTVAQLTAGVAAFAVSMVRARYLTLEQFGAYALATTLVSFFSIVADLGLSVMMMRDLSRDGVDVRRYLGAAFALTLTLASVAGLGVIAVGATVGGRDLMPLCAVLARS